MLIFLASKLRSELIDCFFICAEGIAPALNPAVQQSARMHIFSKGTRTAYIDVLRMKLKKSTIP